MQAPYKMLFNLVIGFKKWEEQKEKIPIPIEVYDGHRLFIYECSRNEVDPPIALTQLVEILQLPSKKWGITNIETIFPSDASLLDKEIGVTIEAEDFLEEFQSPDEFEQSEMKKILLYCREHNLEDKYRDIRTFLSNQKNSVISFQKLYEFKGKINDQELVKLFSSCYENIEDLERYRICPNCGWTLEWKKGHWRCNKENICHVLADFNDLESFPNSSQKLLRMKSGIQKYTLLPGMAELRIAEKLKKRGFHVILYPNIDEYDLLVEKGDEKIKIDVKDYRNPRQLAMYLNQVDIASTDEDIWYVVPDYRCKLYPKYPQRVLALLPKDRIKIMKVMSETQAIRKVGELFHEKTTS